MKTIVEEFITELTWNNDKVKEVFTHGGCYWFAYILKERFNGQIWYLPIDNHFITLIDNLFYDANGQYSLENNKCIYNWEHYKIIEPLESERIEKYCIRKEI